MPDVSVARRYAQAMIELASEAGVVDRVGQDLATFVALLDANDGLLRNALFNPVFTTEERQGVLDQVVPRLGLHELSANLIFLVNDKSRLPYLGDIASNYGDLADERAGRVKVEVATAEPMSPQIEAEVRAALEKATGKSVILSTHVDKALIGGMVARVGGKVYDSSLRTRLRNMRQALLRSPVVAEA